MNWSVWLPTMANFITAAIAGGLLARAIHERQILREEHKAWEQQEPHIIRHDIVISVEQTERDLSQRFSRS